MVAKDANADQYTLTSGETYTVTCRVRRAKPAPDVTLHLDSTNDNTVNGAAVGGPKTDVDTDGPYDDLLSTTTYTFDAAIATHCGNGLYCTGGNLANDLLGNNPQSSPIYNLRVLSKFFT